MNERYISDPTPEDFLEWALKNKNLFSEFYVSHILPELLDAEAEDFFGTEGFDKRYE